MGLNNQFEIDLNGLVAEEALAICKQCIYDLAKKAREEKDEMNLQDSRNYVLAILCADDHVGTDDVRAKREDSPDVFADSYNRVMTGISINEISINLDGSSPSKS